MHGDREERPQPIALPRRPRQHHVNARRHNLGRLGGDRRKILHHGSERLCGFWRDVIHRSNIIDGEEDCHYMFVRIGECGSDVNVDDPGYVDPIA